MNRILVEGIGFEVATITDDNNSGDISGGISGPIEVILRRRSYQFEVRLTYRMITLSTKRVTDVRSN